MTLNELFPAYSDEQKENYQFSTHFPRISIVRNYLLPTYGDHDIRDISFLDINHVYGIAEEKGLSLYAIYAALSRFFSYALDKGYIDETPMKYARKIKVKKGNR